MRPLFQCCVAATLVFALAGSTSVALAATMTRDAQSACAKTAPDCHEAALTCACCDEGGHGASIPALPTSDRTSVSKTSPTVAALLPVSVMNGFASARELDTPITRRAGPPLSLSILHASLLL